MHPKMLMQIAVSIVLLGAGVAHTEDPKAKAKLAPYLDIRAEQTKPSVDIGLEWRPSGALRLKPTISFARPDPDKATGEVSQEQKGIGANLEFNLGGAWNRSEDSLGTTWSFGGEFGWNVARFKFNPAGGEKQYEMGHSLTAGVNAWIFTSIRGGKAKQGTSPHDATGPAPIPETFDRWPVQPQLTLKFARESEAADEQLVVRPPNADGLQLAEKLRLEGPSVVPNVSARLALAFSPPRGQMAFAPVYKLTTKGGAGAWKPWGTAARMRLEGWIYFFAFDDTSAVRVGAAPFIDWRNQGTDTREDSIAGVLLELRSGTERLEY